MGPTNGAKVVHLPTLHFDKQLNASFSFACVEQKIWPRIVQPVVKKSQHTICRICTSRGELNEIILSKAKIDR